MIRILWLCPYQLSLLEPELKVNLKTVQERAAPWIDFLSKELAKNPNIDLHLLTKSSKISSDQNFQKFDSTFHVIRHTFPFSQKGYPWFFPLDKIFWYKKLRKRIHKKIKEIEPDIIHAHGTESVYGLTTINSKIPSIISIQGLMKLIYKADNKWSFQIPVETYTIKKGVHFGCRTDWDKNEVKKNNPGATIHYLPEAMNPQVFKYQWKDSGNHELVFVGSLIERKGVEALLKSFYEISKQFPEVKLNLIGSGSVNYINKLKTYLKSKNIDAKVQFHGFLRHEELIPVLLKSKIFILPTFMDNSPNSLCEAMALGMPCIASDIGGIPSLIEHEENGLLFETGNYKQLAKLLLKLLVNEKLRETLGRNAREAAIKRHLPANVANTTIEVYKSLLV